MKKLLNTLYILSQDSYCRLDGENVVVVKEDDSTARFPLHTLEGIVSFSYRGASPGLMGACAQRGIDLSFFTPSGRFLAAVTGESRGNVLLRRQQYRLADDAAASCLIARGFVLGKVYNSRAVLERARRDHPQRVDVAALSRASQALAQALPQINEETDLESLRGLEGTAALQYFSVLDELILQGRELFSFDGRTRRPPRDPVNAMLSFAYTLLARNCASALSAVGLDPYVGFLHRDRPGRTSLALDLMEEQRSVMADRFVLTAINNRVIQPKHFDQQENGACLLTEDGRRAFLTAWQQRKQEVLTHPFLGEKIPWGLLPHVQALLLARTLRGDLDAYPPFLWK
jgi:CRISPR-associated protein Cas1